MSKDVNKIYSKTFMMMFLGLLVSGVVSYFSYQSGLLLSIIEKGFFNFLLIGELATVIVFSFFFRKLSSNMVKVLYYIYAIINGFGLSSIFYLYKLDSVIYIFVLAALLFLTLSFIGKKTDKNLSSWGIYITVFLIGSFILGLMNIFIFKNSIFEFILDIFVLLLFGFVTIYDVNKTKYLMYSDIPEDKIYVYLAMDLYLDFINIFLRLLSIFGKEDD